ncbi:YfiT family bacillithiol transferase [Paenibacillus chartarius]|uniref:Putative metal-dependent hydrolase ACFFK0_14580 n=1 Tax=Paenibacillus chartarius TaxID=747481 RepID=A0ABV6DM10_9BACL
MEALMYPIGKFAAEPHPAEEHRQEWIKDIAQMPGILRSTVQSLTAEQLLVPYRPGGWNVRQIVHHLADNDMNAYIRFKRALTEETPTASSYRQAEWAELSDTNDTPIEISIQLMEALHQRFVLLLRKLSPEQFERTVISPAYGEMTLHEAAQRYAWHGRHHIGQIQSLIERMGWQ